MPLPKLIFLFRKKSPAQFSIERVFDRILPGISKFNVLKVYMPFTSAGITSILQNLKFIAFLKYDIVHITGDVHYLMAFLNPNRTVLTIHDCVFIHKYSGLKGRIIKYLFLSMPVARAKYITTISEASKREIIKYTGCKDDKIRVIPNPIDPRINFLKHRFNKVYPEILFIGSNANKNLDRVIPAVKGINCKLHIIGKLSPNQIDKLEEFQVSYINNYSVNDEYIIEAYRNCDIVLFPSLFEGFGLPIIEAQQTGRIVITSNIPPMNDICGNGAYLVDPYSIHDIKSAILDVVSDDNLREKLIKEGLINASRFSRERIIQEYENIYQEIMRINN